jgi:hypothetical protein
VPPGIDFGITFPAIMRAAPDKPQVGGAANLPIALFRH